MTIDHFSQKAGEYDSNDKRVANVDAIANTIMQEITLASDMTIMDFGSGTGLLLERIAPYVKSITAVDISSAMNTQLRSKLPLLPCSVNIIEKDLEREFLQETFDGIISSMTLHHIRDIENILRTLHKHLNHGGFIAIADLDSEDGTFHTEDTGVHHHGFDRGVLLQQCLSAGFVDVNIVDASIMRKPHGDFPVFLLTAKKANG